MAAVVDLSAVQPRCICREPATHLVRVVAPALPSGSYRTWVCAQDVRSDPVVGHWGTPSWPL